MIARLLRVLDAADVEATPEEVADALWLAPHLPAPAARPPAAGAVEPSGTAPDTPPPPEHAPDHPSEPPHGPTPGDLLDADVAPEPAGAQDESGSAAEFRLPPDDRTGNVVSGVPARSPAVPALPGTLGLSRALRPFNRRVPSPRKHVIDEDATAARSADEAVWVPVMRPAPDRWLELALVIDVSASMRIWRRSLVELHRLLERQGAFRDIRVWRLDTDRTGQALVLYAEGARTGSAGRSPRELIDPSGRRAVLVASDCVGAAWADGTMSRVLATLGRAGPTAIVQPLPQRMWESCAPDFVPVRLRASGRGTPNDRLEWTTRDGHTHGAGVPVPVMELDARWLAPWASLVAGGRPDWGEGMVMLADDDLPAPSAAAMAGNPVDELLSPLDRVVRFRAAASPVAFQLATFLAAAPLSLPVMRLVQRVMLPESGPPHLAEVFLGGLLRRTVGDVSDDPEDYRYDFRDGVRELLLSTLRRHDSLHVLQQVSQFVSARMGTPLDFPALLTGPTDENIAQITGLGLPFARVAAMVLRGLGGPYQKIADQLLQPTGQRTVRGGPVQDVPAQAPQRADKPPAVWGGVPPRNPNFTGREDLLHELRKRLSGGFAALVPHMLQGLGGVGKTQIAIEYAYRFRSDYDLIWWTPAEQPSLVRSSLAQLAVHLGLPAGGALETVLPEVLDALRRGEPYRNWLLVLDNAQQPGDLVKLLPHGSGHILITSRNVEWASSAVTLEVDVFTREESVELLARRGGDIPDADANRLAERLGDLPLAVVQAAAWRAETGMSVNEYLGLLEREVLRLMAESHPAEYHLPVAATWNVALERLRAETPAAAQLLDVCAFLAPQAISWRLLVGGRLVDLPAPLSDTVRDSIRLGRAIREIGRYGVARIDHERNSIELHRLVQAVLQAQLTPEERARTSSRVQLLLAALDPGDPDDPSNWDRYAELWPHVLPSGVLESVESEPRQLVINLIRWLYMRGDYESMRRLAERALTRWRTVLGENHADTLAATRRMAMALRALGQYEQALAYNQDTMERLTAAFGADHEEALAAASSLGADFRRRGQFRRARTLDQETMARNERVFGRDHPRTLAAVNNYAIDLRLLGHFQEALDLDREAHQRRERVLGRDHPYTLFSLNNLARDLREYGEYGESATLQEQTLARYREVLGPTHPDTLRAAKNLSVSLRKAGRYEEARSLAEEIIVDYRQHFGPDHPDTLAAGTNLSNDRRLAGNLEAAREIGEDTLTRYRRVLGRDHPYTLAATNNLAITLRISGEPARAQSLNAETRAALSTQLSEDHFFTLACANNVATDLATAGMYEPARELRQDVLTRYRRVLGDEHPYTLAVAGNHAGDLRETGDVTAADELTASTLTAAIRVLGEDHPDVTAIRAGRTLDTDLEPPPM